MRGTSLHGLFDDDALRTAILTEFAERAGVTLGAATLGLSAAREAPLDRLASWLEANLDVGGLRATAGRAGAPDRAPGW